MLLRIRYDNEEDMIDEEENIGISYFTNKSSRKKDCVLKFHFKCSMKNYMMVNGCILENI
jgi:hypothetical protein